MGGEDRMISVKELLQYKIDPIPKYHLLRDILRLPISHQQIAKAKEDVLKTKWVNDVLELQQSNGSWGYFHSLSLSNKYPMTTEQALRRLRVLGLDYSDICIQKTISYLERFLQGEEDFLDRREKLHDWDIFTHLMTAAQIRQFSPENKLAMDIANKWKQIIEYAFSSYEYSLERYEEAYTTTFLIKPKGGRLVDFTNFYPLVLLTGLLTKETECKMLEYVISHLNGIYYIYEECLNTLPKNFASKQTNRYLTAVELLSQYTYGKEKLLFVGDWLMNNIGEDGFWDMGTDVKDGIVYPLSSSWRNSFNRKIDCTVKIMSILNKIGYKVPKECQGNL